MRARCITSPPVPSDWELSPLQYVAEVNARALNDSTDADREILYVDIGAVGHGRLIEAPSPLLFGEAPSRARRVVRRNDVLVSTVRTYLRAVIQFSDPPPNLVASTGFAVISPGGRMHPRFLYYWCLSDYFIETVVAKSMGVSYPSINATEVARLIVAVPPLQQQSNIASFLDHETDRLDSLVAGVPTVGLDAEAGAVAGFVSAVRVRRQALITAAVTGQIDV